MDYPSHCMTNTHNHLIRNEARLMLGGGDKGTETECGTSITMHRPSMQNERTD
jgi:hypothetical protein